MDLAMDGVSTVDGEVNNRIMIPVFYTTLRWARGRYRLY